MLYRPSRVLIAVICATLLLGAGVGTADARGVPRVSGVVKGGQDWRHAKLKIRWNHVRGARYVMRVATTAKGLKHGRIVRTGRATVTYTPTLRRDATYFVQVRALRGGAKSRWSRAQRVRLVKPRVTSAVTVPTPGPTAVPAPGPGPGPGPGRTPTGVDTLIRATFDNLPTGLISPANFKATLGGTYGSKSYYDDTSIVAVSGRGNVIRTKLDAGTMKSSPAGNNGATMFIPLAKTVEQACVSYDIRFSDGFDWSLGGKLPGLEGVAPGTSAGYPTGGTMAGDLGWSGRMMWLGPKAYSWAGPTNMAVTYMYNPSQAGTYGDNVRWSKPFVAGTWHTIKVCYTMNDVGRSNGSLVAWMDGQQVINDTAYKYRTRSDVAVSHLLWHIFRGGNNSKWAGATAGYVDLDNFTVTAAR